jgi:hypothetical protein
LREERKKLETHEDIVMMREGKVFIRRGDDTGPLTREVMLSDGRKVTPDGQVMMTDGSTRMMHEGETLIMAPREPGDPKDLPDRQFQETLKDDELTDDTK